MSFESGKTHNSTSSVLKLHRVLKWTQYCVDHPVEKNDTNPYPPGFWEQIRGVDHESVNKIIEDNYELLDGYWVYSYEIKGYLTINSECYVSASNDKQTYKYVDWRKPGKWSKHKGLRPTSGSDKTQYKLKNNRNYYVFISKVQLSYKRLDWYQRNPESLKERAQRVALNDKEPLQPIFLTDAIEIVKNYQKDVASHIKTHTSYLEHENFANQRILANTINTIVKSAPPKGGVQQKIKAWTNQNRLKNFIQQDAAKILSNKTNLERSAFWAYYFKSSSFYNLSLADNCELSDDPSYEILMKQMNLEFDAAEIALGTEYGKRYLKSLNNDGSFVKGILESKAYKFSQAVIKLPANEDIAKFFWLKETSRIVGFLYTRKFKINARVILTLQESVIKNIRDFTKDYGMTEFNSSKMVIVQKGLRIDYQVQDIEMTYKIIKTEAPSAQLVQLRDQLGRFVKILELVNLVSTFAFMQSGKNHEERSNNILAASGALVGTIASFNSVSKLFFALVKTSAKKGAVIINIIGGLLDGLSHGINASKSYTKGKIAVAVGQTTLALGALVGGLGGAMLVSAGGVATTGVLTAGAGWGLILIVIAAFMAIIGTFIVWWFEESDLEIWFKGNYFGIEPKPNFSLADQIKKIESILATFSLDFTIERTKTGTWIGENSFGQSTSGTYYDYKLQLKIKTGLFFSAKSFFKLDFKVQDVGSEINPYDNKTLIEKNYSKCMINQKDFQKEMSKDGFLKSITYTQPLNYKYPEQRANKGKFEYDLTAQLDLHGDGSVLVPEQKIEHSSVEIKVNQGRK